MVVETTVIAAAIAMRTRCFTMVFLTALRAAGASDIMCGSSTTRSQSRWHVSTSSVNELFMDVDTRRCAFNSTPYYLASVVVHPPAVSLIAGSMYISRRTPHGFRAHVWNPLTVEQEMMSSAKQRDWQLSWIGGAAPSCGSTTGGSTGWASTKGEILIPGSSTFR